VADVELPSLTTHMDVGEADLDYSLPSSRCSRLLSSRSPGSIRRSSAIWPSALAQRCDNSQDFQKEKRRIARYVERKREKKVTLNEKEFMDERNELDTDKEEEKLHNPRSRRSSGITISTKP